VFKAAETDRVVGISVGQDSFDIERQLRFTVDFLALIQEISGSRDLRLVQTRKGSFSSFFTLDLKPWAELIEKILFFIPEWKKRKAQNLKIHAEIKKIEAETNQLNTNTKIAERRAQIEEAGAMLELLEKYQALGVRIQFGEEVLVSVDERGLINVDKPERLD
jgi:hypothetical protein